MHSLLEEYQIALKAAVEASQTVLNIYRSAFDIEIKDDGSPVTSADMASSDIIEHHLKKTGIPIISEESEKSDYETRKNWERNWCVDPLDGTREFVKKNGEFAINIALIENQIPVFGIIAHPVGSQVIFGGREVSVFQCSFADIDEPEKWNKIDPSVHINDPLVIACSRSKHSGPILLYLNKLRETYPDLTFIRKGSSLKFFDLANGRADTYPRFAPTMEWDIAAGQAIIEGLGGSVLHAYEHLPLKYNKENLFNPYFTVQTKAFIEKCG